MREKTQRHLFGILGGEAQVLGELAAPKHEASLILASQPPSSRVRVLHGIEWDCMVLNSNAWYLMLLYGIEYY